MKKLIFLITFIIFLLFSIQKSYAIYDPRSVDNNKFGIHILFPEEISEAAALINSSGGDWGYVTIPIRASDRDLDKWQTFMNNAKKYHVIPIIRLATDGDYFDKISWAKPSNYDILDFSNFLNSLSWPTKNRYIIVYNEVNRGDEWGGIPNAAEYAEILNYAIDEFKNKNQDFFIISAGFDNASINVTDRYINQYDYMYQMEDAVPGIFAKIDGIGSHSYPNPAFSSPPSSTKNGVFSFFYQKNIADNLSGKDIPVFITETGWTSDTISQDQQSIYYQDAFRSYWNDPSVIAVTPFIFIADKGPFAQFSFIKSGQKTKIYNTYKSILKVRGQPLLSKDVFDFSGLQFVYKTKEFKNKNNFNSILNNINKSSKTFFKWLLGA
nr:hypothetical protein [Candidatus Levybacteria bacterium]